jgi:hypothetical protein
LFALLGTVAYGAEVYRFTAPDGTVGYSDRPQGNNAEQVVIATPRAGTPATPAQAVARASAAPSATTEPVPEAPSAPTLPPGPTAAELSAQRQQNCEIARERQQRYTVSRRLFRTTPDGEREYLDDRQIDEARAKAAADVEDWCG